MWLIQHEYFHQHASLFIIYTGSYFYMRPSNLSRNVKTSPQNLNCSWPWSCCCKFSRGLDNHTIFWWIPKLRPTQGLAVFVSASMLLLPLTWNIYISSFVWLIFQKLSEDVVWRVIDYHQIFSKCYSLIRPYSNVTLLINTNWKRQSLFINFSLQKCLTAGAVEF